MRTFLTVVFLAGILVLVNMSCFTVDRSEYVYLTLLGRHTATYDGETQAGLYLRWPWPIHSVQRLDRRLEVIDLPATEQLIRDPEGKTIDRTLTVEGMVSWRIAGADGVDRFIRTVGTHERAREILSQQIGSRLGAEIGKMEMSDLISDKPGQVEKGLTSLRQRMLGLLADSTRIGAGQAANQYGIEVVDIRLRRYNYPVEVRRDILERIISERKKKQAEYESEATLRVGKIRDDNEREVSRIKSEAMAAAKQIRGQADAEADRIRNEAFSKDVEFYVFLRKLEEYKNILGSNQTVLLLSSHRDLFDLLFNPPRPNGGNGKTVPPSSNGPTSHSNKEKK